ncbi:hypothetical protein KY290_024717 [Solanum tuberosum]|uniref:Uncharacterized protein n=1 Tax=Solanum tuberosum TaxID=4113 RepID=A0ABQ7UTG9_SOLTU|nr:hypothetical protein KY284_023572 [Solanum tuberosum]KAH0754447.1 hypothetical protein KY290_024717 [Solanum tuberosum]
MKIPILHQASYAPPPPGPQGYPPPGQPEPVGYYGEAPPPPPPGPPSYQGYFNDQYPPPDHIHHDQPADHDSSGCCSFLKGCSRQFHIFL